LTRLEEPQGYINMVAEAELRCRSLRCRDEMPQCRGRSNEDAEDAALSSWPAGGTESFSMELLPRGPIETDAAPRRCQQLRGVLSVSLQGKRAVLAPPKKNLRLLPLIAQRPAMVRWIRLVALSPDPSLLLSTMRSS